jgi:hypothetical protein
MAEYRQKTQYKRKNKFKPLLEKQMEERGRYLHLYDAWMKKLSNLTEDSIMRVADLLARSGYDPNGSNEIPPITKTSPLAVLDGLKRRIGPGNEYQDTLEWKAQILMAAILVYADVIDLDEDQIREIYPLVSMPDVWNLLNFSDIEAFCMRRSLHTKDDIRKKFDQEGSWINKYVLRDMLKDDKR